MVRSPSWEANWFAVSQEIPRISRNPKVHYRTHKRPPPVCILGQSNPVHIRTSYLLEIHLNIIHPTTPRSPQWSPSLRFPHQDPLHTPLLTKNCFMHFYFNLLPEIPILENNPARLINKTYLQMSSDNRLFQFIIFFMSFSYLLFCLQLCSINKLNKISYSSNSIGGRGGTVVKVLCYKSAGCWFDSRWYQCNVSLT